MKKLNKQMKTLIIILFLILSFKMNFGQFPPPRNFSFSYSYIMSGDWGPCGGTFLTGPAYCSNFFWNTPDLSSTLANLIGYKVHFKPNYCYDCETAYFTTDTVLNIELGVMGWVWATALYENPNGESDSSEVFYNDDLPIYINLLQSKNIKFGLFPNPATNEINIEIPNFKPQTSNFKLFKVFGIDGKKVLEGKLETAKTRISTKDLESGVYFIEVESSMSIVQSKLVITK